MIARSLTFTLRSVLHRVGLTSAHQCNGLLSGIRAALGDWPVILTLALRTEILLRDRPERLVHFCQDCAEDTPHDGFDEFGVGWYAQIFRCRYCGGQGMRVWPLAWW